MVVAQHFIIFFLCLLKFGRADIPICTQEQEPKLKNDQIFCLFANYSRDVPAVEYYGQRPIEIKVISDLMDLSVNEESVFWTASIQISLEWSDNRILMDANVNIKPYPFF